MAKVIRQKLGASKTRLINKTTEVDAVYKIDSRLSLHDAMKYSTELGKKIETFRRHVEEYEKATTDNEADEDRFLVEYVEFEEILHIAEELVMKLDCIAKHEADREKKRKIVEDREMSDELELKKEKLRISMEQETERYKIESQEKVELEKVNLEKAAIAPKVDVVVPKSEDGSERRSAGLNAGVKLPRYELMKFEGDILKWQEFWDSYEASVHNNNSLQAVDKFNYLKVQLEGKAKDVIAGLDITNANYDIAVKILKERFGNKYLMIDAHYSQLRDLPPSNNNNNRLRSTIDSVEKHLRSLESLGENVQNNMIISLIKSKLPKNVITRLEECKVKVDETWNLDSLRKEVNKLIMAQEAGERQMRLNNTQWLGDDEKITTPVQKKYHTGALHVGTKSPSCIYCGNKHWSDECTVYPDVDARRKKLVGHCYGCLRKGHGLRECRIMYICVYCKKKHAHHRSLCPVKFSKDVSDKNHEFGNNNNNVVYKKVEGMLGAGEDQVIMQTATVTLVNPCDDAKKQKVRLLFDCGSQRTYVSKFMAEKLKLKQIGKNSLIVQTFGKSKAENIDTIVVEIGLKLKSGFTIYMKANVVPNITGKILRQPVHNVLMEKISQFELADTIPTVTENTYIDLLVGNDYYADLISLQRVVIDEGLYLLQSKLGWVLSGRSNESSGVDNREYSMGMFVDSRYRSQMSVLCENAEDTVDVKPCLEEFWRLDTIGIKESPTESDDDKALVNFNEKIKFVDGRYCVGWPWRNENPDLPDNYILAYGRLRSNLKRLKENPKLLKSYDDIIKDQLNRGIIEEVQKNTVVGNLLHYMPHHCVVKPGKSTTKVRVVCDGSAKIKKGNLSLNECLFRGPVILEDLGGLLMRFRSHEVAIVADIEKAFLQVGLLPEDRDVTRFLWVKDHNKDLSPENMVIFRFTRVLFGIISSMFLLAATVRYHLLSVGTENAKITNDDIYVDNVATGKENDKDAIDYYNETKKVFMEMSMNLREWGSNSKIFMKYLPREDRVVDKVVKILGMTWNMEEDTLSVPEKNMSCCRNYTKREILKCTAGTYDPLGLYSPVTLRAKLLLQVLWMEKYDWDVEIAPDQIERWKEIEGDLKRISKHKIERFVGNGDSSLLCFCDASAKAYATCIYIRCIKNGVISTNLLFSKSRIASTEKISIPRLELLAVLIGVRCMKYVKKHWKFNINREILWTDSKTVLYWIGSKKYCGVFVKNRIDEIRREIGIDFRYICTTENPADLATRGKRIDDIVDNSLWWFGPVWLIQDEKLWPLWNVPEISSTIIEEVKACAFGNTTVVEMSNFVGDVKIEESEEEFPINLKKYSSLIKLLRITSFVIRFVNNLKKNKIKIKGCLNSDEIQKSKMMWIKQIQIDVIRKLKNKKEAKESSNDISQLGLRLDEEGVIRCHGRLITGEMLNEEAINPIYIPRKNYFTTLLINDYHKKLLHSGVSHTLSEIRNNYWIPKGRRTVNDVLRKCTNCRRFLGGPYKMPQMMSWPAKKVHRSAPFTYSGLDYLGPIYVKDKDEGKKKVWICLFTCVVIRAVHLEVVSDMSAEKFIMALRRFIAKRGKPEEVVLDNASQFKTVKTVTDLSWKNVLQDEEVYSYVSSQGIKWSFITEFAPWEGGFYERLVGLVKMCIRKSVGSILLSMEQLQTFSSETEAVINSRPLVYVEEGECGGLSRIISPQNFLSMIWFTGFPDVEDLPKENLRKTASNLLEFWKKGQKHLDRFWKLWRNDYLLSLRERYGKCLKSSRIQSRISPALGQIVHIKDKMPRGAWKMAKIEELIKSSDGEIRSARIKLPSGIMISRPLNLLYPLETDVPRESDEPTEQVISTPEEAD